MAIGSGAEIGVKFGMWKDMTEQDKQAWYDHVRIVWAGNLMAGYATIGYPDRKDGNMLLNKICPNCGTETVFNLNKKDYDEWMRGKLIQTVFPEFTPMQRETMITGFCEPCWEALMIDEDE